MNKVKLDAKIMLKQGFDESSSQNNYTNFFNALVYEYQSVLSKTSELNRNTISSRRKCILVTLHAT